MIDGIDAAIADGQAGPRLSGRRNVSAQRLCTTGALFSCIAFVAFAQSPTPSVIGKTCRGTFELRDVAPDKRLGAFQIRFAGTIDKPTAHLWRGFGSVVWQKVGKEVNDGRLSDDLTGFSDLGEAQNLLIEGNQVTFGTSDGANVALIYNSTSPSIYDGTGISSAAPGEPLGRLQWRGATAHVVCR